MEKGIYLIVFPNIVEILIVFDLNYIHSTLILLCLLTINLRGIYTAPCVMIFMRGIDITRGIGRVLLKVEPVLGPEIARTLPMPQVMSIPRIKIITRGAV